MLGIRTTELEYTRAEDNGGQERISFIVSTEAPATDGGILRAKGVDLTRFKANPVLLYGHDDGYSAQFGGQSITGGLPIGRAEGTKVIDTELGKKTGLLQEFTPALQPDQDSELAKNFRFIWSLVRDKFIRMVSVRYGVTEYEQRSMEELQGMGLPPWGFVAKRWKLWETSLVSIGADAGAMLQRAWESGKYQNDDLDRLVRLARPEPIIIGERQSHEVEVETTTADPALSDAIRSLSDGVKTLVQTVTANTAEVKAMRQSQQDLIESLDDDDDLDPDDRAAADSRSAKAEPDARAAAEAEATRKQKEADEAIAAYDAANAKMRAAIENLKKKGK